MPRIGAQQVDPARLDEAQREQAAAEAALAEFRDAAGANRTSAGGDRGGAGGGAGGAVRLPNSARAKLAAEAQALAEVLAVKDGERWPPMVDALVVPDGLETALGAALGEELTSALDPDAARHWRELPPFDPPPALPEGAAALAALVQGPPALARALSQIGLVEDDATGEAHQSDLAPGQVLVSRSGRNLAVGRLYHSRRHPHPGGGAAATAQSAGDTARAAGGGRANGGGSARAA